MHATERSRNSTCSTDNGSSHAHDDTRLTHVVSNLSTLSDSPKHKHSQTRVLVSTRDAYQVAPQALPLAAASISSTGSQTHLSAATAVHLTTLLTTGQRKSWKFAPTDTIQTVRTQIWQDWPESWPQPRPESADYLRLLHLGHILDDAQLTLASRGCKAGATTVVHMIIRSIPPPSEPVKMEQQTPVKTHSDAPPTRRRTEQEDTPGCSCVIC
ncbi:uncharacterized protein UMAG_04066 [Mycosarcoma maydis]|uniref:UBL3-like ubiquitin domain-containing protein n=1 Tax=Mycosarcoma maydis TaxID=5270 RepID=A0A0D1DZS2_MYCMD|nr:uncharacterized protein UMAG_04066 [Ustilago maydis 521]KIS68025.1 hypothetical protein UMAG_04066 [Ustilago maydis 521]|eukprot:XP_011390505.1 hypothetical protein UMAG_04066 [Ustilago maydis 521]